MLSNPILVKLFEEQQKSKPLAQKNDARRPAEEISVLAKKKD